MAVTISKEESTCPLLAVMDAARVAGWGEGTRLSVLCEYVSHMGLDADFEKFLAGKVAEGVQASQENLTMSDIARIAYENTLIWDGCPKCGGADTEQSLVSIDGEDGITACICQSESCGYVMRQPMEYPKDETH